MAIGSKFTQPGMCTGTLKSSFSVLILLRMPFSCLVVVSKTWVFCSCFAPTNAPTDLIFSCIDKNVSKVHIFMIVVYNTTLRYENVNKSIPRPVQSLS